MRKTFGCGCKTVEIVQLFSSGHVVCCSVSAHMFRRSTCVLARVYKKASCARPLKARLGPLSCRLSFVYVYTSLGADGSLLANTKPIILALTDRQRYTTNTVLLLYYYSIPYLMPIYRPFFFLSFLLWRQSGKDKRGDNVGCNTNNWWKRILPFNKTQTIGRLNLTWRRKRVALIR